MNVRDLFNLYGVLCPLASSLSSRGQRRGQAQSAVVRIRMYDWIHRPTGTGSDGRWTFVLSERKRRSQIAGVFYKMICFMCVQVLQRPTAEQKQQLAACSKRVAGAVTELIQTAEAMKGTCMHKQTHARTVAHTQTHTHTDPFSTVGECSFTYYRNFQHLCQTIFVTHCIVG